MTHPNLDTRYTECPGCHTWQSKVYRACPKCGTVLRITPTGDLFNIPAPPENRRTIKNTVISVLTESGRWMTSREVREAVEAEAGPYNRDYVARVLRDLTRSGSIRVERTCMERHERNLYCISGPICEE